MNNTATATTAANIDPMIDPRPLFARAVSLGRQVVAGIQPEQFDNPTPCSEFDVRQLAGHVLAVLNRVAVLGAGGDFFSTPQCVDDVADTDWADAYLRYAHEIQTAWTDDSVLGRIIDLPWAQLPGAITLMIYTNEITVHTWDLAKATGQQPAWDLEVLQAAYVAMQRGLPAEGRTAQYDEAAANMPEDSRGFAAPFADVVPVADDAPMIDRLVAWNGRRP